MAFDPTARQDAANALAAVQQLLISAFVAKILAFDDGTGHALNVSQATPMPVSAATAQSGRITAEVIAGPPFAQDFSTFTGAKVEIAGLNTDSILIEHSASGVHYFTATTVKHDLTENAAAALSGPAANGIYSIVEFGGYLRLTRTGTADNATLSITLVGTAA